MSPELISAIALLSLFGILATYKGAQHVSKSNKQVVSNNSPNNYTRKSDEEFIARTRENQQKKFNSNFSQTQKTMNKNGGKTSRRKRRLYKMN